MANIMIFSEIETTHECIIDIAALYYKRSKDYMQMILNFYQV